jgi:hypothetical protein
MLMFSRNTGFSERDKAEKIKSCFLQLAKQKPILPSIAEIDYHEDEDARYSTEVNKEVCHLFFKTLGEKCPHLV